MNLSKQHIRPTSANTGNPIKQNHRDKIGIEVELLMPPNLTRHDLALEVARRAGGTVKANWHLDHEPLFGRNLQVLKHLTPRFVSTDQYGNPLAAFVNDVTITSDLSQTPQSRHGWLKVISEDLQVLQALQHLIPTDTSDIKAIDAALAPIGLKCEQKPGAIQLVDSNHRPSALAVEIADDSPRVAECISPPLTHNVDRWLELVIGSAANLGATVPAEGATHLHYDAPRFASAEIFRRLVWAFGDSHFHMRNLFNTNTECRHLGPLPEELIAFVEKPSYSTMTWPEIKFFCQTIDTITKFSDVNLSNLIQTSPVLNTVEFRMLPASVHPNEISFMIDIADELVTQLIAGSDNVSR